MKPIDWKSDWRKPPRISPRPREEALSDAERLHYLLHNGACFLLTREQQEEVTKICDRLIISYKGEHHGTRSGWLGTLEEIDRQKGGRA